MRKLFLSILVGVLVGCGVPQVDYDKVLAENAVLKIEIDDLKNGEQRLIAIIEQAYEEDSFTKSKDAFNSLQKRHPHSKAIPKYAKLMIELDRKEKTLQAKREAEEKEKKRLANLNKTGVWQVTSYVDDFGESTSDRLIRNLRLIRGRFSNSATQDSKLDVRFLIDGKTEIDIILYEYAGNNPVKAYSPDEYQVLLQDKDGNRHKLRALNRSDRLSFGPKHSRIVFEALLKGGKVKFRIVEVDTPTTQYAFEIKNADYFDNAVRLMNE
ncbi:MAG: hypothetical protein COA91_08420 [Robiginitomaculum sp.]|nr:MAG: hypothetical protein COA91_08420 [Robiginitomaculum sp.]